VSLPVTPDTVVVPRLDVRVRRVGGDFLVGIAEEAYSLSESGAFIWRQINGRRTVREIAERLATEYDVDDATALDDTSATITELNGLDLVRLGPEESAG